MSAKIVVVGSSNTDMIIKMPRIPAAGETLLGGDFSMAQGGKGANQAVAAARAGGSITLIACIGDDMFGMKALQGFEGDGINVEHVYRDQQAPSGVALIFVGEGGENSIGVAPGANAKLMPRHIEMARSAIAAASILVIQLEIPDATVLAAMKVAAGVGAKVILNPAPCRPLDDETLRYVSILTPNESEAEMLTGVKINKESDADKAAAALLSRGLDAVLITLGARGTYVGTAQIRKMVPAFIVNAVDSTAAGDVFNGTLAVALAEKSRLLEAVRFANAAAALSVTKLGAQPSAPRREAIEAFMEGGFDSGAMPS